MTRSRWHIAGSLALLASLAPAAALAQSRDLEPAVQTSQPPAADASPTRAPAATPRDAGSTAPTAPAAPAVPQSGAARGSPSQKGSAGGGGTPAAPAPVSGAAKGGAGSRGQDRIELDTTQISGNRELPKVMYVVPWRKADLGDFAGRPPNSLLDEALTPVDRDVFRRQNRYFSALQSGTGDAKSQPGVTAGGEARAESKDER